MVKLYFDGFIYDFAKIVDEPSISVSLTGDKTQDTASFVLPSVKGDRFSGLDMTRPLPRFARVRIKDMDFVVQTDTIEDLDRGHYRHTVECVGLGKVAIDTTSAGLTVTQPQGDIGLYYRSYNYNAVDKITFTDDIYQPITLQTIEDSNDPNEISGLTLKANKKYTIQFKGTFFTNDLWRTSDEIIITTYDVFLMISVGGVVQYERMSIKLPLRASFAGIPFGKIKKTTIKHSFEYENTGENQVKVYVKRGDVAKSVDFEDIAITISTTDRPEMQDEIKLDYVVEKLLHNDANKQKFFLDDSSKAFLSGQRAYEWTLPASYLWLNLVRIADYVKAFVDIYFEDETVDSRIMVSITPFSELGFESEPVGITADNAQATIDDYAAGIEINAKNVYGELNTLTETTTLRGEGEVRQVVGDDLIVPTSHRIGQIYKFEIRVPKELEELAVDEDDWLEIDLNRILREEYYNTLTSQAEYTGAGRFGFSKNNTLFYREGDKNIYGLSYFGEGLKAQFEMDKNIRAIYELMIGQLVRDNGNSNYNTPHTKWDDGTTTLDNKIAVRITYRPYTETNVVVYKSDQSGFQHRTTKFLNEEMAINSPDVIGTYTQGIADRSGGTVKSYTGTCLYEELPSMLSTWGRLTLFGIGINFINKERVNFSLRYIKDYVFVSAYESYDRKERLFQAPKDVVHDRVIKKNTLIVFDTEYQEPEPIIYEYLGDFIGHIAGFVDPYVSQFAVLDHDGTETVLPTVVQAVGRAVEYRVSMKDNYSAGLYKYVVNNNTFQRDYKYTNDFGRVENTTIKLYTEMNEPTLTEMNALPAKTTISFVEKLAELSFNEKKDARERSVYSIQFAYLSDSEDIIIYDDIAKFSNVAPQTQVVDIRWVEVAELPQRNQKTIDVDTILSEVVSVSHTGVGTNAGQINLISHTKNPLVCYNFNRKEILLVDTRKELIREIHYRGLNV